MDLQTVKTHIKSGKYSSIDDFLKDMFLIFSNCVKYNKWNSKLGKTASGLKRYFEKRCNSLGLKDLHLQTVGGKESAAPGRRRSGRLKN